MLEHAGKRWRALALGDAGDAGQRWSTPAHAGRRWSTLGHSGERWRWATLRNAGYRCG